MTDGDGGWGDGWWWWLWWWLLDDGGGSGWVTLRSFECPKQQPFRKHPENYSTVFLNIFGPHLRVMKTSSEKYSKLEKYDFFRIKKFCNFSTRKNRLCRVVWSIFWLVFSFEKVDNMHKIYTLFHVFKKRKTSYFHPRKFFPAWSPLPTQSPKYTLPF